MNWFIARLIKAVKLALDRIFGPAATKKVVKIWQKAAKREVITLKGDGDFGPKSRKSSDAWLAGICKGGKHELNHIINTSGAVIAGVPAYIFVRRMPGRIGLIILTAQRLHHRFQ